jgi:CBS domain-containing protein
VRVREIMSSPLVTRAISAVPVADDGALVAILSEADLIPLELAPDPRAHLAPLPEASPTASRIASEAMTPDVVALPEEADVADAGRLMLERRIKSIPVLRGRRVVDLTGLHDPVDRRLATLLARGVPGVLEVRVEEE